MKSLKPKRNFSKPQLLVFLLVFSAIGYLIFRSFALPNPNLSGDLNGDNTVNVQDLSILLSNYNTTNSAADINSDGTVNVLDLSILLSHYGQTYSGGGTGMAWDWDATTAALDPNSAALIQTLLGYGIVSPNLVMNNWAVATADSATASPCYNVPLTSGGNADSTICIPLGTKPDPSGDGHLTIRDSIHGRETDFWQAKYDSTSQRISSASAGTSFPIGSVNEITTGWGGDAANLPLRRGLVTPDEIKAGVINHPLVFSTPFIGSGSPRYPAVHNAATCGSTCTNHLVEGTWTRISPSVNCSSFSLPAWQVAICTAIQKYGMFLRDNAGSFGVYGQNPINGGTTWSAAGLSGNSAAFSSSFPWSQLQVLSPPPQ